MDIQKNKGRLYPIPTADDTLNLKVFRLPCTSGDCVSLEIAEEHHLHLLKWMKGLAYEHADAESDEAARAMVRPQPI